MARKTSAGILLYRRREELQVFLIHPGGPFWARKDAGAWSIPKGEVQEGEEPLQAARRELTEETGFAVEEEGIALQPLKQPGGKTVYAWAVEGDCDPEQLRSNLFEMEWPPRSGRKQQFPEADRGAWFGLDEARRRMLKGQLGFLEELAARV